MREVRCVLYAHNMPPSNSYSYYPPDSLSLNHYVLLKSFCRGRWRWAHRDAALVCHRNHPANVWRLPYYLPHWHRLQLNAPLSSPSPCGLSLTTLRHLSERKKMNGKNPSTTTKKSLFLRGRNPAMELNSLAYPVPDSLTTSITHTRVAHIRLTVP